jgi:hypothetical protein
VPSGHKDEAWITPDGTVLRVYVTGRERAWVRLLRASEY